MKADVNSAHYKQFEAMVAQTGNTYAFDGETSVKGMGVLLEIMKDMGLDPMKTAEFRKGMLSLFNIDIINMPDLTHSRYIFTPNHVSDLDALILGLLHPKMRIVAKIAWTENAALRQFLDMHYDVHGLDRSSLQSLRRLLVDSVEYFNAYDDNRHYLVFSQGTISNFNHNSLARISPIAQKISDRTGVPIVPMFIEQASLHNPTRFVFGAPMQLSRRDDFREIWLAQMTALQNALQPPARQPNLSHKHANNNKPDDPFF